MRLTSNPVFRHLIPGRSPVFGGRNASGNAGLPVYLAAAESAERQVTFEDIVARCAVALAAVTASAFLTVFLDLSYLAWPALIVGLGIGLYMTFRPRPSAALTMSYSLVEGIAVGAATQLFSGVAVQAIVSTGGVFVAVLVIYKTRVLRLRSTLSKWTMSTASGLAVVIFVNVVASFASGTFLRFPGNGIVAVIVSLVCVAAAAFSLLMNFEVAEQMVRVGAASKWSWYVAFGVSVAVVWLYLEMIRLLASRF